MQSLLSLNISSLNNHKHYSTDHSLKKSLPLLSTTMNAGKFSTSTFQTASIPELVILTKKYRRIYTDVKANLINTSIVRSLLTYNVELKVINVIYKRQ